MFEYEDFLGRIPATWTCIRCGKEFPNTPTSEQPHAFEIEVGKDGRRYPSGNICKKCYGAKQEPKT